MKVQSVRKRDGRTIPFDKNRIVKAITKCLAATKEGNSDDALKLANKVVREINQKEAEVITVEEIQDIVENTLILSDFVVTAKAYILYRQKRAIVRKKSKDIPQNVKDLVNESKKYFKSPYSEFIYYRSYSRWIPSENRRETWIETVDRYVNFMRQNLADKLTEQEYTDIRNAILNQEVMPSMRLFWSAGEAASKTNTTVFNCSFTTVSSIRDFCDILYILMCGCGVGFSVEQQHIHKLPQIEWQKNGEVQTHVVDDSKEGWANAFEVGLKCWFSGEDVEFDFSQVRPNGTRLKTMGGKASGPAPLKSLFSFTRSKILSKQGRRLSSLDVHDIVCKIGEIVVTGGVRRSALLSLSDLDDQEMRVAKSGQFYLTASHRSFANNSVAYNYKPSTTEFMDEWIALAKSGTGERGIFNRGSLQKQMPQRRWKGFKKGLYSSGVNPCGEIILKSKEMCNLSEVVAKPDDTFDSLLYKIRLATIVGTYQSTLTDFKYISPEWKKNCDEERLLGVSITGQFDCAVLRDAEVLKNLRETAIEVNKEYAKRFGINESVAITAIKPSGSVSSLVDASSGMHPRYAKYYIRRVRIASTDSLLKMLQDQGFPVFPDVGQNPETCTTYVLEFPMKAPEGSVTRNDLTAIQQLEYWKMLKVNYTEHNPSVTILVSSNEWIEVANWVYNNWDIIGGVSFLPREEHNYILAPYEEITEEKYNEMLQTLPQVDFSQILLYEQEDETEGHRELACVSGVCEL